MKKLFTWLKESNRYKHLLGGIAIGAFANSFYCAAYAGIGVATALELKDKLWGGKFDLVDLSLTLAGVAIGYGVRIMII
nr:MAG TPA: putative periplasmic lipoprotein [Caudoviricetes sp.]